MRTPNLSSAFYAPGVAPSDPEQLRRFIEDELRKIAAAFALLAAGHIDKTNAAPAKPREGDIRLADGTQWKPNGTGAQGVWCYYNNTWNLLG
ncbi:MAG: hypothetical protein KGP14_04040 [Betaproteobacteria bacterium]|nr:hypothetical protein [Betaproteobacteria bacterium]